MHQYNNHIGGHSSNEISRHKDKHSIMPQIYPIPVIAFSGYYLSDFDCNYALIRKPAANLFLLQETVLSGFADAVFVNLKQKNKKPLKTEG